ncbi:intron-binding protein aquarius [Polychytrium aggregatum]|uniref:intron-binding protein aquarius n=1 Tax=Polychytrium aggregatum TaxID=110093 RepID=UPI0022FE7BD4|nr:intron-binding protein aquarius [Polychytrium aggregatum]KAI9192971.1 intron-binding protein aquarius [Polychytrium aggregatum]
MAPTPETSHPPKTADLGFFSSGAEDPMLVDGPDQATEPPAAELEAALPAADQDSEAVAGTSASSRERPEIFAPTLGEIESDEITKVASLNWGLDLADESIRFDTDLARRIWESELLGTDFSLKKIMLLEYSQYLERYLWPGLKTEETLDFHVLSIIVIINEKFRERVTGVWDVVTADKAKFASFFAHTLRLMINPEGLSLKVERFLVTFLINAFASLENKVIRSVCQPLVGIGIWVSLADGRRELEFGRHRPIQDLWKKAEDQLKKSKNKPKIQAERVFFSRLVQHFYDILESIPKAGKTPKDTVLYCERFLELMIDIEAQLSTRRFVNVLLHDHHFVAICQASALASRGRETQHINRDLRDSFSRHEATEDGDLFVQLLDKLEHYTKFEIDDYKGIALSDADMLNQHYRQIHRLQKLAFAKYRDVLEEFALANVGSIESHEGFTKHFSKLDHETLIKFCRDIGVRAEKLGGGKFYSSEFLCTVLERTYCKRKSQIEAINSTPLYPNEIALFDEVTVPNEQYFSNDHCLAIPKLNLQFLTVHDYLLRNLNLFRLETTYEIRQDIEDAVQRLSPKYNPDAGNSTSTVFSGWARMAVPVTEFRIRTVSEPKLGEVKPAYVTADVSFSLQKYSESIQREWDTLRPHDIVFLIGIQMEPELLGWNQRKERQSKTRAGTNFRRTFGIKYIRGGEVGDFVDDNGRPLDESAALPGTSDGSGDSFTRKPFSERPKPKGHRRNLRIFLDTNQYQLDLHHQKQTGADVYGTLNVLMRRKPQENNFKAVLETIRDLMQSDLVVPNWLEDIFLGYGNPGSAAWSEMPEPVRTIDFRDTFLDWSHLASSFPGKKLVASSDGNTDDDGNIRPPFIITFPPGLFSHKNGSLEASVSTGAKRKLPELQDLDESMDVDEPDQDGLAVRTYKPLNMGPYPENIPKKNAVPFTSSQVQAIHSGTSLGLTMIVGPPGTGKTDVAVQIIANLYHNYPEQHTLLITHSNQALNQLFEKIAALDIDPRHLLRLGHGMEELEIEGVAGNWGKAGRVNSFLEKRLQLLAEVDRLAASLEVPGAHGSTCETAGYFYRYHILTRWEHYLSQIKDQDPDEGTLQKLVSTFPFAAFFSNAPEPLFASANLYEEALDVAEGCFRHLKNIFEELEEIRAFELLKSSRDRSNYLLIKEAKIIALTCTHAALKRRELVQLGFKYDNVVMEEAAQILEVETFIPLLLQSPEEDGKSRLKRVIMIGDHNQLPPVVKNMAFQKYGNMEQSMFTRFVRLGVPTIELAAQGRSRSSIAELFRWRYHSLGDLPSVCNREEYQRANPGLAFEFQLIDVGKYLNKGETEPRPHFVQNLGEAEYVVATYQYMRLLGYPAEKISILTTYNGQKELIHDVLERRCSWNPLFGRPAHVSTVDKFQGQQNDYILLSLVRTKTVGHLRDVRRLIVAMSRARLGLYVFCRQKLFQNCFELQPVFSIFAKRPTDRLWLVTGEKYGAWDRAAAEPVVVRQVAETSDRAKDGPVSTSSTKKTRTPAKKSKAGPKAAALVAADVDADASSAAPPSTGGDWKPAEAWKERVYGMAGVEAMGTYVHQMIQEQLAHLKVQRDAAFQAEMTVAQPEAVESTETAAQDEGDDDEDENDA